MFNGILRVLALAVVLCPALFAIAECEATKAPPAGAAVKPPPKAEAEAAPAPDAMANSRAAEHRLLLRQREEAQRVIRELSQRMAESSDPQARQDLIRQIAEAKREARLEFLRTKAAFARSRGEFEIAGEIEKVIGNITKPHFSAPVSKAPKEKTAVRKDGRP